MKKLALIYFLCCSTPIFAQELSAKIQKMTLVCASCHGTNGIGTHLQWPNIAGQHVTYTVKQLKDMKTGITRSVPLMQALVTTLSDKDIEDLAAYYAKMPQAQGATPDKYLARGQALYRGGDFSKKIPACIACHGPKGTGNAQAGFPALSGQHAAYTVGQLKAYSEGRRSNDLNHIMHDISSRMSDDDMESVAHYIEGLH